ncbi:DUF4381 domain-containing protein [Chitinophaga sp. RAB17]|uniref:DUF4381 domain-containing protein n=1 Tax=Chitinophaga sp. RAB17 TaxID=3233049 RepID=UPI003F8F949E
MQQPTTQQYGDLLEPAPVPFSFNTPGWYVVDVLLLITLLILMFSYIKYYQRNRYRREAIQWLDQRNREPHLKQLYEADMLLKRVAMRVYGAEKVATLRDREWINFLNKCNRRTFSFSEDDSRMLFDAFYRNPQGVGETEAITFILKTRNWIRYHHHALRHRP